MAFGRCGAWAYCIYGISNIPEDIAEIFAEIGVRGFVYLADNDNAGDIGASNLRTLLLESEWKGEGGSRKFAGAGIPEKGDANDLLCHVILQPMAHHEVVSAEKQKIKIADACEHGGARGHTQ